MSITFNTSNQRLARDLDQQISEVSDSLRGSMLPIVEVLIGSSSHRPIAPGSQAQDRQDAHGADLAVGQGE